MKKLFLVAMSFFFLLVIIANILPRKEMVQKRVPIFAMNRGVAVETFNSASESTMIYFQKPPTRVAVFEYNNIESMLALGLADKIVITDFDRESRYGKYLAENYPLEISKIKAQKLVTPNAEPVLYADPDFILGWRSLFGRAYLGSTFWWQERGINTYIVATSNHTVPEGSIEEEIKYIDDMGKIFACTKQTDAKIMEIREFLKKINFILRGKEEIPVLVLEGSAGRITNYDSKWLVGDLVKKAGGKIISDTNGIGAEEIIRLNPEVIFVVHFNPSTRGFADDLRTDPKYNSLRAVKEGRIYTITLDRMYATGFRTIDSLKIIFAGIHPEITIE